MEDGKKVWNQLEPPPPYTTSTAKENTVYMHTLSMS